MESPDHSKPAVLHSYAKPFKSVDGGFTLIEILIAVLIVSIIATIAVPSYARYMTDARRTDAMSFLSEVAGEQQRYFSQYNEYAKHMQTLGYAEKEMISPDGHYSVKITNPDSTLKYLLTATPVTGGKQAGDEECLAFTLSSTGARANTGTKANCW